MCLGVPGRIIEIYDVAGLSMGRVDFGGVVKEACLAYVPEAAVGDYVLVHVGMGLARIDEDEARRVFDFLDGMDQLGELDAIP